MHGKSPEAGVAECLEEATRPVDVVAIGADGDELQGRRRAGELVAVGHPGGVAAELAGVFFGRLIAAAAPALIADAPVLDVEGLGRAVGGALGGEGVGGGRV